MMIEEIALFPLNVVLFPNVSLTLHIFEERYRLLITRCIEERKPFGVIFSDHDQGEFGFTLSYDLGTMARIKNSVSFENGHFLISTIGLQRFRIVQLLQYTPYLIARTVLLPDDLATTFLSDSHKLRFIYDLYWQVVAYATDSRKHVEQLPKDTLAMTYHLAHRLQVPNKRKQHWLEVDSTTRIREITLLLQAEITLLPRLKNFASSKSVYWPWSWN